MDINKLKVTSQDIDKNTGRIILPTPVELENINTDKLRSKMFTPTPTPANYQKMEGSPPIPKTSNNMESGSSYASFQANHTYTRSHKRKRPVDAVTLTCICLLFLILPLGYFCIVLINENRAHSKRIGEITESFNQLNKRYISESKLAKKDRSMISEDLQQLKNTIDSITNQSQEIDQNEYVYLDETGNIIPEEEVISGGYVLEE